MIKTNDSAAVRSLERRDTFKYWLVGEGIIVGLLTGFIVAGFRALLVGIQAFRAKLQAAATGDSGLLGLPAGAPSIIAICIVLLLIAIGVAALLKYEPDIAGSGIPQVESELHGKRDQVWYRVLLAKIVGCAGSFAGGLALGREGPSIQIGAMVGKGFSRSCNRLLTEERMLITCGAGAGLSAAFGAPLAGAIFALEELHRNFSVEVLISTMGASAVADFVVANVFGFEPIFNFDIQNRIPLRHYGLVILLGILLGLLGILYNKTIEFMQDLFARIPSQTIRVITIFAIAQVLVFVYPIVLGNGSWLVDDIRRGEFTIAALAVLLIAKFLFSTASFGSGVPGGIFLPMLVLGAITGGLFAESADSLIGIGGQNIPSFTLIAMAGLFAAIVRAPVTGVVLITEMTGNFSGLLSFVLVSLVAYVVADMSGVEPIYTQLMRRQLGVAASQGKAKSDRHKVIIDSEVHIGSKMDGGKVSELGLPRGSLIVAVVRDGEEIIPSGETILMGGDLLEILCRKSDISETEAKLSEKCRQIAGERMER